ncbi:MAG: PilN domain-containing protein [Caldiserica bacterium]|nr:PilN domain-containing protein [Caldisericota bacterium]
MQLKSKIKEKGGKSGAVLLELLREISLRYPGKEVSIEKIIFTGEGISLEGTIPSYATLDRFVGELSKSPRFGTWEIVNAESKKEGKVKFHIRSQVK